MKLDKVIIRGTNILYTLASIRIRGLSAWELLKSNEDELNPLYREIMGKVNKGTCSDNNLFLIFIPNPEKEDEPFSFVGINVNDNSESEHNLKYDEEFEMVIFDEVIPVDTAHLSEVEFYEVLRDEFIVVQYTFK